jgi:hypothetical protein
MVMNKYCFFVFIAILFLAACGSSASHIINDNYEQAEAQEYVTVSIGDIIRFGEYYWRVLDVDGNYALILTENVIGRMQYHNALERITWETSHIREYLNDSFYSRFLNSERKHIRETRVINPDHPWYNAGGGNSTIDKIFLLSLDEVVRFFGDSGSLQNKPDEEVRWIDDDYNDARIAVDLEGEVSAWWLRSPNNVGEDTQSPGTSIVNLRGSLVSGVCGYRSAEELGGGGIRPALWLRVK